jgi:hypothetical protein
MNRPTVSVNSVTIFYRSVMAWNKLPLEIRKAENYNVFRNGLEKFLWSKFYDDSLEDENLGEENFEEVI